MNPAADSLELAWDAELPWQGPQWTRLARQIGRDEFPHALLIHGPFGVGKRHLARRLVLALMCDAFTAARGACGQCRNCHLASAGAHPDAWTLAPEESGGPITIDRVRDLIGKVGLTSNVSKRKVALLGPAEAMNRPAANALLKTLEEPPGNTVLILVSDAPAGLPQTIRSRCQGLSVGVPSLEVSEAWLRTSAPEAIPWLGAVEAAPLAAIQLLQSEGHLQIRAVQDTLIRVLQGAPDHPLPVQAARTLHGLGNVQVTLGAMLGFVGILVRVKFGLSAPIANEHTRILTRMAERIEFSRLYRIADRLLEARRTLRSRISLNEQLLLEDLAVAWSDVARES